MDPFSELRNSITQFLSIDMASEVVPFETLERVECDGYTRLFIRYRGDEDDYIPAYLFIPRGEGPFAAVIVHHQHNGQRHLGKSEVCGLVGDPLQAFGPALAQAGVVVLAPDSICFEDRRTNRSGTEPDGDADFTQHYNQMCYRLVRGDTLMRKVLSDAARGVTLLSNHPVVDPARIGALGHSYGGNTVLFSAALDTRISFACSSGAACTYAHKMLRGTGIEMAEVIPGFVSRYEIVDLVRCMAPRRLLVVSAAGDKYSADAEVIVRDSQAAYAPFDERLTHLRYQGGHPLTEERFTAIINWVKDQV